MRGWRTVCPDILQRLRNPEPTARMAGRPRISTRENNCSRGAGVGVRACFEKRLAVDSHISTEDMGSKNGTRDMPPTAQARAVPHAAKPDQERA